MFLQQLQAMDSYYVNEHIINLLLEVRGNLRTEKQEMLSAIDRFLSLSPDENFFTIGRRLNIFFLLDDLKKPELHKKAEESLKNILGKSQMLTLLRCVIILGNPKFDFSIFFLYLLYKFQIYWLIL